MIHFWFSSVWKIPFFSHSSWHWANEYQIEGTKQFYKQSHSTVEQWEISSLACVKSPGTYVQTSPSRLRIQYSIISLKFFPRYEALFSVIFLQIEVSSIIVESLTHFLSHIIHHTSSTQLKFFEPFWISSILISIHLLYVVPLEGIEVRQLKKFPENKMNWCGKSSFLIGNLISQLYVL